MQSDSGEAGNKEQPGDHQEVEMPATTNKDQSIQGTDAEPDRKSESKNDVGPSIELNEVVVENHKSRKEKNKHQFKGSGSAGSSLFREEGNSLSWSEVNFQVTIKPPFWKRGEKPTQKTLIHNSCGYVKPGISVLLQDLNVHRTMLAIMGPSGSGKSTLLDILAGRIEMDNNHLSGNIYVNGLPRTKAFKRISAYVMQDDTLQGYVQLPLLHYKRTLTMISDHKSLSVKENLMFSANLRLPSDSNSHEDKVKKVEEVMEVLGLTAVADTAVGDPFHRGVSGGQRRRVSVGMELLSLPSILFLDEPTSGLDSTSALKICSLLKDLARQHNITVICTIHQPSTAVYHSFDNLLLMSGGRQVYFGNLKKSVQYFSKLGHQLPAETNPADYYADLINLDFETDNREKRTMELDNIVENFAKSKQRQRVLKNVQKEKEKAKDANQEQDVAVYATNVFQQLYYLLGRTLLVYSKNPALIHVRIAMYSMMALMLGSCFWKIESNQESIQDRISALFFSVGFLTFMSIAAFPALIEDRLLFFREWANGYYRVIAYALSHTFIQLPFIAIIAILYSVLCYWMMELNDDGDKFWYFLVTLYSALFVAESLVMIIAALIPWYLIGIAMAAAMYGMFMILNGYFVKKTNIPDGWIWGHYLSFQKYAFEGMVVNEFSGRNIPCNTIPAVSNSTAASCWCLFPDLNNDCIISGDEVIDYLDYNDVDKWGWFGILWIFVLAMRVAFYAALALANKTKR